MKRDSADPRWSASLATAALALVLGWFAFVRGVRVPILGMVDLGVHEFGHLLFSWAPRLLMVLMGNGTQSLLPLAVAVCFGAFRRDWPACGLCLAWCGTTLQDASVYIADAPFQRLPLLKEGSIHDWAYVLGAEQFYALDKAALIATIVKAVGLVVLVVGLCVCLVPAVLRQRARGSLPAQAYPEAGEAT
ncbi:MAG TPA: hypothetical protein VGN27_06780 [Gaiellaceae bacterium]|jgi:hypothetical protein|nr:hypothetical protein [Gaiellaceae bacterium]